MRTSSLEVDHSVLHMRQPMMGRAKETGEYARHAGQHQKPEHIRHKAREAFQAHEANELVKHKIHKAR